MLTKFSTIAFTIISLALHSLQQTVQTVSNSTSDLIPDYFAVRIQDKENGTTTVNVACGNPFWIRFSSTYKVIKSNLGMQGRNATLDKFE